MDTITKTLQIGKLTCYCVSVGSHNTCYLPVPMALDKEQVATLAKQFGYNIVSINGIDWDNDLTPWTAPGVLPEDADFQGKAIEFLTFLKHHVIPETELFLKTDATTVRTLIGVSLSGLFALWAWTQGDVFTHIGSISGSFWYDGFTEWFCSEGIHPKSGNAYLSLGDKEGRDGDTPRFRTVQTNTKQIVDALHKNGIRTVFEQTSGTHFAPFYPRLKKAFKALAALSATNK